MATTLERNSEKLYQALQELGSGWHTRQEIADYLGKSRLTGHDASALDLLVMQGRIIAERHEIPPPTTIERRWVYMLDSQEAKNQQKSAVGRS
ncbi:MAG: hypothetical protein ACYDBJ_18060 [Aggregatilineales bacterium]